MALKSKKNPAKAGFLRDRAYKPGSVLTAIYLAPQLLTGSSHLLGTAGQAYCPTHGVAPDRVYIIKPMSPWAGCALTAPFHPCLVDASSISLALPQAAGLAHFAASPLPTKTFVFAGAPFDRSGGGISLLHLSWGHPRQALPVILALWSPDFPHLAPFGIHPRLSGPVAPVLYSKLGRLSNILQNSLRIFAHSLTTLSNCARKSELWSWVMTMRVVPVWAKMN